MVDLPPVVGTSFLHDVHAVKEAVQAGTTQDVRQQRLYQQWADFCTTLLVNPDLQYPSIPRIKLLHVYLNWVRHTKYYKRWMHRLGKESISQA